MASGAPPSVSPNAPALPPSFAAKKRRRARRRMPTPTCSRRRWTRRGRCSTPSSDASATPSNARWRRDTAAESRKAPRRLSSATSLPAAAEKRPSPASAACRRRDRATVDSRLGVDFKTPGRVSALTELAAPVDDVSEALESVSLLSGDRKTPIRAVKRSIDAYLERRRVGSSAGATTTSSASSTPVVAARSVFAAAERRATVADPPERADRPEPPDPPEPPERRAAVSTRVGVAMTAKQRALQPPTLATRDDADATDSEPFAYAPVYSPVAAREATESLHSPFRKTPFDAADETADAFGNSFSSKRRFSRGVEPVGVDLRARLRAAGRYGHSVSPRERVGERTSQTRDSDSDSTSVSDDRDTAVAFPKGGRLHVPETSSSSSEYDESNDGDGNTNVSEMVSFCRRYRAARVRASVLERWMYQARLSVALAVAHHEHSSRARAFYAWRAERLERAIRVEVALRFAKHARKTHARRLLAKTVRAWLRETRRSKAFRVHEMASTTSSKSNEDGLAAARSRLRPVHGLAVEDAASKETQHPRVVGDSTAAVAETGTMTEDVDVVEKNALETVPVSLEAFLRVLVDGLVDEAVARSRRGVRTAGLLDPDGAGDGRRRRRVGGRERSGPRRPRRRPRSRRPRERRSSRRGRTRASRVPRLFPGARGGRRRRQRGRRGRRRSGRSRTSGSVETLRRRARRRGGRISFSATVGATTKRRGIATRRRSRDTEARASVRPAAKSRRVRRERGRRQIRESDFGSRRMFEDDSRRASRFVRDATPRSRRGFDRATMLSVDSRRRDLRGVFVHRGVRRREQCGGVVV